jgi:hypothetical protein
MRVLACTLGRTCSSPLAKPAPLAASICASGRSREPCSPAEGGAGASSTPANADRRSRGIRVARRRARRCSARPAKQPPPSQPARRPFRTISAVPHRRAALPPWSESGRRHGDSDLERRRAAYRGIERRVGVEVAPGQDAECRQDDRTTRCAGKSKAIADSGTRAPEIVTNTDATSTSAYLRVRQTHSRPSLPDPGGAGVMSALLGRSPAHRRPGPARAGRAPPSAGGPDGPVSARRTCPAALHDRPGGASQPRRAQGSSRSPGLPSGPRRAGYRGRRSGPSNPPRRVELRVFDGA